MQQNSRSQRSCLLCQMLGRRDFRTLASGTGHAVITDSQTPHSTVRAGICILYKLHFSDSKFMLYL